MTVFAGASGGYRATAMSSIDRAIRLSAAAAVLAVAGAFRSRHADQRRAAQPE